MSNGEDSILAIKSICLGWATIRVKNCETALCEIGSEDKVLEGQTPTRSVTTSPCITEGAGMAQVEWLDCMHVHTVHSCEQTRGPDLSVVFERHASSHTAVVYRRVILVQIPSDQTIVCILNPPTPAMPKADYNVT